MSTRARLFYDLLHFRGCPFTKSQFSKGAINRIHFFQLLWHFHTSQEAWESKLEIAYFLNITFRELHFIKKGKIFDFRPLQKSKLVMISQNEKWGLQMFCMLLRKWLSTRKWIKSLKNVEGQFDSFLPSPPLFFNFVSIFW